MKDNRSDLWNTISLLKRVIVGSFATIICVVTLFVVYLLNSNTSQTIDATGVYNLVNSENGQVIATDLTSEDINKIMELLNGEN